MSLADTHCHLGGYHDRDAVLDRAAELDLDVLVATSRPSEADLLDRLLADRPRVCVGIGFHPESAGSVYNDQEFAVLGEIVDRFTWVSEVGLDRPIADLVGPHFGNQATWMAQYELLERVLDTCGPARGYSLHARGAVRDVVHVLRRFGVATAIMHSFTGDAAELQLVLDGGFRLSAHPSMLETPAGRELLAAIPDDRILLETDGPYFTWDGHRIEPAHLTSFLQQLADVRQQRPGILRDLVAENFRVLTHEVKTDNDRNPHAH